MTGTSSRHAAPGMESARLHRKHCSYPPDGKAKSCCDELSTSCEETGDFGGIRFLSLNAIEDPDVGCSGSGCGCFRYSVIPYAFGDGWDYCKKE